MSAALHNFRFRPLVRSDLPMFHGWLQRPHIAQWWSYPRTVEEVDSEYLPVALGQSTTRAYPSEENERAIRSYKRAGFEAVREVDTPDGPALLMIKARTDEAHQVAERSKNRFQPRSTSPLPLRRGRS